MIRILLEMSSGSSSSDRDTGTDVSIVISDVIEYLFCPRFIYFMYCLDIPQHEERHYKVLKGRELHETREKVNKGYIRKKLHCVRKEISVYLASKKYHVRGIVDEVLFLEDGTAAPFDYKFAEYRDYLFRTHKYQSALYGLMIAEHYGVEVKRGFICYARSNYRVKEIEFREKDFKRALEMVDEILYIIQHGFYPKGTSYKARCVDCTYRRICD